jgi:hypothetical protein
VTRVNKGPERLGALIARPDSALHQLARRAEAAAGLSESLRGALPPALAQELRAASLRDDGTLVVVVSSSVWSARLRFESEALLARCRERHPEAQRVEVRVGMPP